MSVITGTEGDDGLFGSSENDSLQGLGGNDSLYGFAGDDFLRGGAGADWLDGGDGIDTADYNGNAAVYVDLGSGYGYGGEAEGDRLWGIENVFGTSGLGDTLLGSSAANVLYGFGGNDGLYGRDGDDTLAGMDGDDFLQGGAGADTLDGGNGVDTVDYNGNVGVYVDLSSGVGYGGEAEGDVLGYVENVWGTVSYGDTLLGNMSANALTGYGGDDRLHGREGDDVLSGMSGDDFLQGGSGADRLEGGDGIDIADYNGDAGVFVDLSTGLGYWGEAEGDTLSGIENVWGTAGYHDKLVGSDGDNRLSGFGGSDDLWGLDGNDTLSGGYDGDTIVGGTGNDVLEGGQGDDFLAGDTGTDSFRYIATGDSPGDLTDFIADFSRAEGDRIDLSAIDADIGAEGDQTFIFIGSNPFVTGHAGQLRVEVGEAGTLVMADVNGDATADLAIVCQNIAGLVGTDFVL